jgi:hypothetical protein
MFLGVCAYISFKRTPDFVKAPVLAVVRAPLSLLARRQPPAQPPQQPGADPLQQRQQQREQQQQRWEQQEQEQEQERVREQERQQMRRRMDASGEVWELDEELLRQQQQQRRQHEAAGPGGGAQHLSSDFASMEAVSSEGLQEQLAGSMQAGMGGAAPHAAEAQQEQQKQQQQQQQPASEQPPAGAAAQEAPAPAPDGAWHGERLVPPEMGERCALLRGWRPCTIKRAGRCMRALAALWHLPPLRLCAGGRGGPGLGESLAPPSLPRQAWRRAGGRSSTRPGAATL